MFVNFAAILAALPAGATFRLANEMRPPSDYLLNTLLPERNLWTYHIEAGNMTVRSTMAGLVGTDSSYPPGGMVEASTFLENTAKIAVEVMMTEAQLRQIQEFLLRMGMSGQPTDDVARDQVLNFLEKVVIQPMLDRAEWLRGRALCEGAINWTFNGKALVVDYGIPAANFLPVRTIASTTNYAGVLSAFWSDVQKIRRALRGSGGTRAILAHSDTIDEARYNPVNQMIVTNESTSSITFRKIIPDTGQFTADAADTVTIVLYDGEGEVLNPADTTKTLRVPFMTRGKLVGIGNNVARGFRVGDGGTPDPNQETSLGYTHIGPTIEGGGRPGRWSDLYTPQGQPYQMNGRGAMNLLPVIEAPDKLVIATTEMTP
jgi:hypothetical protein